MTLSILYRGPLASCNYACRYCPFAKRTEDREAHETDRAALERFVDWSETRAEDRLSILFTPWGEALIHRRYQDALIRLTGRANVARAAVQTNLSCRLDWVEACDREKLALWATFHPSQTTHERFLRKCRVLDDRRVRYSVGVVGRREHFGEIEALRHDLPAPVYLWVNAYKRRPGYYTTEEIDRLASLDPLFPMNLHSHPSRGRECRTGESVLSVDGEGNIRRCHYVSRVLGNLYEPGWETMLYPRKCPKPTCDCYLGYAHLPHLELKSAFGDGVLERVPSQPIQWQLQPP
ncbi:MAG: STM4011 family radical SAM protein [Armatimonadetes bacterium]|nr:STM4011 family radical SAM protein [Armatimonadota bacterium]